MEISKSSQFKVFWLKCVSLLTPFIKTTTIAWAKAYLEYNDYKVIKK